jgi:phosphoribosyl 1,2-cyclic phosphodiesterase
MKITFWGVRGSIATAGQQFARAGGHTTCVEIEADGERIVIDAGTGIRGLGNKLAAEARVLGRYVDATILFTHLHWDHIQGFPFFSPAFGPCNRLDLFGPADGGVSLEDAMREQMRPPMFPITLDDMAATKSFHTIGDDTVLQLGGFTVRARALCHPQGSLGYRIERAGRSLCFATDTEHPDDGSVDERLLDLARGVDALIHDAQFTEDEYEGRIGPPRRGWGHSTYVAAAQAAQAAGAKSLFLTHHDPGHDDDMVDAIERSARSLFTPCRAARETQPVLL